ncbi:MAG: FecR domain-containing protein [Polyangiaceae bacterium]
MALEGHLQEPELSSAEREALWSGVHHKRRGLRRRRRAIRSALFVASLAVVGVGVHQWQAYNHRTELAQPTRVKLPDGSSVVSQPGTDLEVVEGTPLSVRIDLRSGSAYFEVVPNPDRRFSVMLAHHEVKVVGTRFVVKVDPDGNVSEVDVSEGTVEVLSRDGQALLTRVHAGGHWSSTTPSPLTSTTPPRAPTASVAAAPEAPAGSANTSYPSSPSAARPTEEAQAAALFDQATLARRRGDYKAAIAGYESLLKRFPKDRHASLAALELGRLKRTREADPEGAADALEQAAKDRALNDDALAQLVLSYDQAGDQKRCLAAQSRYLARHPKGVHVNEVRASCKGSPAKPR